MSNRLEFSLGLTSGAFLAGIGKASGALKVFTGGMLGVGAIANGVWAQVGKGAKLDDLSKQTGESVGSLYSLQKGLQAAGLNADGMGGMIFRLNSALGGISETGEPTAKVFAQMGLRIEALKGLNAPEALGKIAERLAQLNKQGATAAAGKIFGRDSAREILQLARSSEEFGEGLRGAAAQAARMQRYAPSFDNISKNLERLKGKTETVFLGIAGGLAPAFENVLKSINKIDLSGLGEGIGTYMTALTQAFQEGKLGMLVAESLAFGFESAVAMAPGIFAKLGAILIKTFEMPLMFLQAGMEYILTRAQLRLEAAGKAGEQTGGSWSPSSFQTAAQGIEATGPSFAEIFRDTKKKGLGFDVGFGEMGVSDIDNGANQLLAQGTARMNAAAEIFMSGIMSIASRAPQLAADSNRKGSGDLEGNKDPMWESKQSAAMRGSRLEKMGFVMGSGGAANDHGRETARNTAKTVEMITKLLQAVQGDVMGVLGFPPYLNQRV